MNSKQLVFIVFVFVFCACQPKVFELPTATTGQYTTYPETFTIVCNGEVKADGGAPVTDRGVCYMQGKGEPDITGKHASAGRGVGSFMAPIEGISFGYWSYRAYATNSEGTAYGEVRVLNMTTEAHTGEGELLSDALLRNDDVITLSIGTPENITTTTAVIPFSATRYSGIEVIELGVMYSATIPTPDWNDYESRVFFTAKGVQALWTESTIDTTRSLDNLKINTTYYVRAYALTKDSVLFYSNIISFTTTDAQGLSYTISDFLGTWSCRAYNFEDKTYEAWDNVKINTFTGPDNEIWVVVDGIIWGQRGINAFGRYDSEKHCIRLYSGLSDDSKTFTAPAWHTGDTTFYAHYYAVYAEGSNWYILKGGKGYNNLAEAWFTIDKQGKITYGPSDSDDNNGRRANALYATFYYSYNNSYYNRSSVYTNLTFTRTNLSQAPKQITLLSMQQPVDGKEDIYGRRQKNK